MQFAAQQQFLQEDQAFLLAARGVICLQGERAAEALQPLITSSLNTITKKPVLAYVLDDHGSLKIDCFVVTYQQDLLVEIDKSLISALLELLAPHCRALSVSARDVSADWRVFAELPDQTTFDDGSACIKYVDPRWHMGVRLLRPANAANSSQWGSEIKWATHAHKLGFLPSTAVLQNVAISPLEAGLHTINLLDSKRLPKALQVAITAPEEHLSRRLLPMRIEPNSVSFATMVGGLAVLADDIEIGQAVCHHGLFALALIDLELWRSALAAGTPLHCADQAVLISWPSWLAQESRGRGGPVAMSHRSQ